MLSNSYDPWMARETNMLRTMHAPKGKTRWIFLVLKAWERNSAIHIQSFPESYYSKCKTRYIFFILKAWEPSNAVYSLEHSEYASFSKAQNTVNILRSTQQRCIFPRAPNTVNMLRSQSVISRALHTVYIRSHKTLWIFAVRIAWGLWL